MNKYLDMGYSAMIYSTSIIVGLSFFSILSFWSGTSLTTTFYVIDMNDRTLLFMWLFFIGLFIAGYFFTLLENKIVKRVKKTKE